MTNPAAPDAPQLKSMERLPFKTVAGYGAGDFALQPGVQSEHRVPAVLLHRRRRHLRRRGRHHVPGRATVGRLRRPARRPAGRPDHDPVGQVPAVHHVRRDPAAVHELRRVPRADQLRRRHEAHLRLRHLRDPGSDLLAGQHPLRLPGLGGHPVGARARQAGRRPRLRRRHRRRHPHLRRRQLHLRPARPEGPHPEPGGPDRLPGRRAGCVHQGHPGLHRRRHRWRSGSPPGPAASRSCGPSRGSASRRPSAP